MADIKTRTVDKTSIKTMDQSISASHRIRDAGAEIKHAGRQEIDSSEQSVSEYSTARFENAIHRTVAKAEHAAERGFDKGTWIAQHKMREHGIKERFKVASAKEAEDMATATTVKSRASVSPQFFGWITGIGAGIQIDGPKDVKEEYRNFIAEILSNYVCK